MGGLRAKLASGDLAGVHPLQDAPEAPGGCQPPFCHPAFVLASSK
jgi:hypothetical protein